MNSNKLKPNSIPKKKLVSEIKRNRRATLLTYSQKLIMPLQDDPISKRTMNLNQSRTSQKSKSGDDVDEMISTIMNTTEIDEEIINQG